MADSYDTVSRSSAEELYAEIRAEAFGVDLGQSNWLTLEEQVRFAAWLEIGPDAHVLDVACGSGGPALHLAERFGCRVLGIDINGDAIAQGNALAVRAGLEDRVRFDTLDARRPLPFASESFDVIMCVDAISHFPDRIQLLREWQRVLKPGGRLLFTDPLVITGAISHKEIAARCRHGVFLFVPPGEDERRIRRAGLDLLVAEDLTLGVAEVAARWLRARAEREEPLRGVEGTDNFDDRQELLETVAMLARERRLSRFAFVARRSARSAGEGSVSR